MVYMFYFTSDEILKGVKRESSYLAERRLSESGEPLLDELVYDEEYDLLFRDHFLDARAKVIAATLAYSKTIEANADFFETNNLDHDKDFVLFLEFPETFAKGMVQPITVKLNEYIVSHIMYRWLEMKLPNEAAVYENRAANCLADVKSYTEKRITTTRRTGRLF